MFPEVGVCIIVKGGRPHCKKSTTFAARHGSCAAIEVASFR